ncbi:predicted protein [Phaeodactylum tricornutum CCAP 1055/1]|uniref:MYND-type domain-containing protein n=1 Tax=Phaeodactylum tricornutum (strain CCAP 1055/1) TaxID=556484 RepID=B7GCJ3_PHATC|nr:predicted protein [Phaeodactylum tricornutum CCAP 1055/1]EEC43555.1 predicted protein [Phaeodactylum tricornutum CCAP 1055/1]|eukprot:XP_002184819.1 predicted protein [Phaeodactylum tricornutum CCAP 1055/1]
MGQSESTITSPPKGTSSNPLEDGGASASSSSSSFTTRQPRTATNLTMSPPLSPQPRPSGGTNSHWETSETGASQGSDGEVVCHACGFEASYVPEGMLHCERCRNVSYCSLHCQQWDWTSGGHSDLCVDARSTAHEDSTTGSASNNNSGSGTTRPSEDSTLVSMDIANVFGPRSVGSASTPAPAPVNRGVQRRPETKEGGLGAYLHAHTPRTTPPTPLASRYNSPNDQDLDDDDPNEGSIVLVSDSESTDILGMIQEESEGNEEPELQGSWRSRDNPFHKSALGETSYDSERDERELILATAPAATVRDAHEHAQNNNNNTVTATASFASPQRDSLKAFRAVASETTNVESHGKHSLKGFRHAYDDAPSKEKIAFSHTLIRHSDTADDTMSTTGSHPGQVNEATANRTNQNATAVTNLALKTSINKALRDFERLYGEEAAQLAVLQLTQGLITEDDVIEQASQSPDESEQYNETTTESGDSSPADPKSSPTIVDQSLSSWGLSGIASTEGLDKPSAHSTSSLITENMSRDSKNAATLSSSSSSQQNALAFASPHSVGATTTAASTAPLLTPAEPEDESACSDGSLCTPTESSVQAKPFTVHTPRYLQYRNSLSKSTAKSGLPGTTAVRVAHDSDTIKTQDTKNRANRQKEPTQNGAALVGEIIEGAAAVGTKRTLSPNDPPEQLREASRVVPPPAIVATPTETSNQDFPPSIHEEKIALSMPRYLTYRSSLARSVDRKSFSVQLSAQELESYEVGQLRMPGNGKHNNSDVPAVVATVQDNIHETERAKTATVAAEMSSNYELGNNEFRQSLSPSQVEVEANKMSDSTGLADAIGGIAALGSGAVALASTKKNSDNNQVISNVLLADSELGLESQMVPIMRKLSPNAIKEGAPSRAESFYSRYRASLAQRLSQLFIVEDAMLSGDDSDDSLNADEERELTDQLSSYLEKGNSKRTIEENASRPGALGHKSYDGMNSSWSGFDEENSVDANIDGSRSSEVCERKFQTALVTDAGAINLREARESARAEQARKIELARSSSKQVMYQSVSQDSKPSKMTERRAAPLTVTRNQESYSEKRISRSNSSSSVEDAETALSAKRRAPAPISSQCFAPKVAEYRNRKRCAMLGFIFLLVVLPLAIGLGVGLRGSNKNRSTNFLPDTQPPAGSNPTPSPDTQEPTNFLRTRAPSQSTDDTPGSPTINAPTQSPTAPRMETPIVLPIESPSPSNLNPVSSLVPSIAPTPTVSLSNAPNIMDSSQAPTVLLLNQELFRMLSDLSEDNGASILRPFTPQRRAFEWLASTSDLDTLSNTRKVQRFSLSVFFFTSNGSLWRNNSGWLTESDECTWYSRSGRTTCDGSGVYLHLELGDNDVAGRIATEIGLLTGLRRLDLTGGSGSRLSSTLPTELGVLSDLEFNKFVTTSRIDYQSFTWIAEVVPPSCLARQELVVLTAAKKALDARINVKICKLKIVRVRIVGALEPLMSNKKASLDIKVDCEVDDDGANYE